MARVHRLLGPLGLIGCLGLGQVAFAQGVSTMTPSSTPESIPGGTLLLVAYAFAWAVVLLYVFMLWRKSKRIDQELADITAKLKARSAKR